MGRKTHRGAPLILLAGLAACSGQGDKPAAQSSDRPATTATDAAASLRAQSAALEQMRDNVLRDAATQALHENRMYAPAGDNALEYYLALRAKHPDDATISSALTDLMPYTLIAAEQSLAREELPEAKRLIALIERTDAKAPALPRLKAGVDHAIQSAASRPTRESAPSGGDAEQRARQQVEQNKLAEQQTREVVAARQIPIQQEAARQQAAEAERQAVAKREAEQQATAQQSTPQPAAAATPATPSLHPISTPAPRYPPEALRAGTAGEVLVEITIGTDGSVTSARVLRATPVRVFDRETLNAIKRWKFEPVAAPVTTRRTLSFNPGS
ncbi:MAG: energy transducer TonB [Pseudomonas sp.]